MSKKTRIWIMVDSDVWISFKNYVFSKYGTLHRYLGEELSRAMEEYLRDRVATHTQTFEHKLSRRNKRHLQLLIWLLKTHPCEILYSEVRRYILSNLGSDQRTIKKYLHEFLIDEGFVEIKMSLQGNKDYILKVNAEKIYKYLTNFISEDELKETTSDEVHV